LPVYNINHSRFACFASCSKRACAFAVGAGMPRLRWTSYRTRAAALRFNLNHLAGSIAPHAVTTFVAFIAVLVLFHCVFGGPETESPEVLRLSGLRRVILENVEED